MSDVGRPEFALWITKQDALPDVCIDCGVFSDRRVKMKGIARHKKWVKGGESGKAALGYLAWLLGPIGWLVTIATYSSKVNYKQKEIEISKSIKVPQCDFCRAESARGVVEFDWRSAAFAFYVHTRFRSEFERLNPQCAGR